MGGFVKSERAGCVDCEQVKGRYGIRLEYGLQDPENFKGILY